MNSQIRHRNYSRHAGTSTSPNQPQRKRAEETGSNETTCSYWVRSSFSQLRFLRSVLSVDPEAARIVEYAIGWAPFGGADCEELIVAFGVDRRRFLEKLDEALQPRRADRHQAAWLKRTLLNALMSAWRAGPKTQDGTGSTPSAPRHHLIEG
ncbi:hypothetical protein [Nocardia sp. NPDC024068]|uniref:hypothetical protein n=1 Tax=Nocardia sp. NPDC024068 TaxID=3157197 RepID=UPI0033D2C963